MRRLPCRLSSRIPVPRRGRLAQTPWFGVCAFRKALSSGVTASRVYSAHLAILQADLQPGPDGETGPGQDGDFVTREDAPMLRMDRWGWASRSRKSVREMADSQPQAPGSDAITADDA
jgi:hypothetical protein